MNDITQQATENLRVIRDLMERSTVYRTISAPVAIFGGVLALAAAAAMLTAGSGLSPLAFIGIWLVVYCFADGFNALMLWRNHQQTGDPFFSSKLIHAVKLLAPPLLAGAVVGILAGLSPNGLPLAAIYWSIFYGLALLATHSFSPRSIKVLGSLFLTAGLALLLCWHLMDGMAQAPAVSTASWIMGGTFGLFHVVYGIAVRAAAGVEAASANGGGEPSSDVSSPSEDSTLGLS